MNKNKFVTAVGAIGIVGLAVCLARKKHKNSVEHKDQHRGGKRALQLASVASMIDQFTIPNIEILQSIGYQVDVVADFTNPGTITAERCEDLKERLKTMGVRYLDIPIPRSLNLILMIRSYNQVKRLLERENYNLLHCHSPIGGVIARQAAKNKRKDGLRVIYTAHGFHFFDGAPVQNWLLYYPIEKWMSRYTDVLITINREDYKRASKRFHARETVYIPGVGVDIRKLSKNKDGAMEKRKELGVGLDSIMLLSVGELSVNKNHEIVMKALSKLNHKSIHYFIAGTGGLQKKLETLAVELKIKAQVHFLGYRSDIAELCHAADLFVFPSHREGCPVALMEAIACRTPVICSRIRGNTDLVKDETRLFDENSVDDVARCLKQICVKRTEMMNVENAEKSIEVNFNNLQKFDMVAVKSKMKSLYEGKC